MLKTSKEYRHYANPKNKNTTHILDHIAESFGEKCYEVPAGFKYISAGIDRYNAILVVESSGGLTVRGHIHDKDSIYAASLFIEMVCCTGKSPSKLMEDLENSFGHYNFVEFNLSFNPKQKENIHHTLMIEKKIPLL